MIKLLIADDEKIIRETISRLIDWKKLGITLIGTAENGLDALNMILDESPQIVMTDIRMPGISGLDLIGQIASLNRGTEFIILSGYGEFSYAKEAMRYGVRHYLLKPCSEAQITEAVLSAKEAVVRRMQSLSSSSALSLSQGLLFHIISEAAAGRTFASFRDSSECSHFPGFFTAPCTLHYIHYLEYPWLEDALLQAEHFFDRHAPGMPCFYIYVENTLLLFYPSDLMPIADAEYFLKSLSFSGASVSCLCRTEVFPSAAALLENLLPRLARYETIYLRMFGATVPLSNKDSILKRADALTAELLQTSGHGSSPLRELTQLLRALKSLPLVLQSGSIILSRILSAKEPSVFSDGESFFFALYQCDSAREAAELIAGLLERLFSDSPALSSAEDGTLGRRVKEIVAAHLSDPELSLKWISERQLFMNPDYVSKCFLRETGEKFSHYLARTRVEYAKRLFSSQDRPSVQEAACRVGCGNNPLYFGQLFKKYTGVTPSVYLKKLSSGQ